VKVNHVSGEQIASIFRVEGYAKQETCMKQAASRLLDSSKKVGSEKKYKKKYSYMFMSHRITGQNHNTRTLAIKSLPNVASSNLVKTVRNRNKIKKSATVQFRIFSSPKIKISSSSSSNGLPFGYI
jgi:GTP1/Obg family GTP-binding protein